MMGQVCATTQVYENHNMGVMDSNRNKKQNNNKKPSGGSSEVSADVSVFEKIRDNKVAFKHFFSYFIFFSNF